MLKVEHQERTITVISDDAHGESIALGESIEFVAPQLAGAYYGTLTEDGELRWQVDQGDWENLLEVLEAVGLEDNPGVNPDELEEAHATVQKLVVQFGRP